MNAMTDKDKHASKRRYPPFGIRQIVRAVHKCPVVGPLDAPQKRALGWFLYKRFARVVCERRKHNKATRNWSYRTAAGAAQWWQAYDVNGKKVSMYKNSHDAELRAIMNVPRDKQWYRIEDTEAYPADIRKKCVASLRRLLYRWGYQAKHVRLRCDARGIYVQWRENPHTSSDATPVQTEPAHQSRRLENGHPLAGEGGYPADDPPEDAEFECPRCGWVGPEGDLLEPDKTCPRCSDGKGGGI